MAWHVSTTGRLCSFAGHTWGVSRDLLVWKEVNQSRSLAGRKVMLNSGFAHSSCYHRVNAVWPGSVCDSWSSRWEEWWVSGPPLLFQMSEGEVTTTGFSLLCCSWSSPVREMVLPLPSLTDRIPSCCSSSKTVREVTSDRAHPIFLILQSKGGNVGLHSPVSPLTSEVGRQWWNSHPPCS